MTSGGEEFLDGDINTCINVQQEGGATLEYQLNVNKDCQVASHANLRITAVMETNCNDLESIFVIEKVDNSCDEKGYRVKGCEMKTSNVEGQNKICSLSCKCDDSMNACEVQVYSYSRKAPLAVQICEIQINN